MRFFDSSCCRISDYIDFHHNKSSIEPVIDFWFHIFLSQGFAFIRIYRIGLSFDNTRQWQMCCFYTAMVLDLKFARNHPNLSKFTRNRTISHYFMRIRKFFRIMRIAKIPDCFFRNILIIRTVLMIRYFEKSNREFSWFA
jgi:hypothetical protein